MGLHGLKSWVYADEHLGASFVFTFGGVYSNVWTGNLAYGSGIFFGRLRISFWSHCMGAWVRLTCRLQAQMSQHEAPTVSRIQFRAGV